VTTYTYNQAGYTTSPATTIETDGYGNDTVHSFTLDYPGTGDCGAEETSTRWYQGSSNNGTSGTVLKEVDTSYSYQLDPLGYNPGGGRPRHIDVLPTARTTKLNGVVQNTTTYGYDTLFTAEQPYLIVPYTYSTTGYLFPVSASISYEVPTTVNNGVSSTVTTRLGVANNAYQAAGFLSLPNKVVVNDESNNAHSTTVYGYDEAGSPQGVFGNLTSTTKDYGTKTTILYNALGMPTQTTDPDGNAGAANHTTYYTYDSTGLYVTKVQKPSTNVPHISYYQQDYNTGLTTAISDENASSASDAQHTTFYSYDPMGRLTQVSYPDGGQVVQCFTDVGGSICAQSSPPYSVVSQTKQNATASVRKSVVYDGVGRAIQTQLNSDPGGTVYADTTYDLSGRKASVSNPYRTKSDLTYGISTYNYDAVNRIVSQIDSDGSSKQYWCYNGVATGGQPNCKSHIGSKTGTWIDYQDENGNQWQRTSDTLGRLVEVAEPNGTSTAASMETDYNYDVLNNLTSVTQYGGVYGLSGARVRSFTYDNLSRLLCASNPENSAAACPGTASSSYTAGTVGYSYDSNGNVITRTDARGVKTTYSYDALNRVASNSYSDGVTPSSCYQYDSPITSASDSNPKTRLTLEWTQPGTCSSSSTAQTSVPSAAIASTAILSHDAMGRITAEQQGTCPSGACSTAYWFAYSYNLAGDLMGWNNGMPAGASSTATSPALSWTAAFNSSNQLSGVTTVSQPSAWTASGPYLNLPTLLQANSTTGYDTFGNLVIASLAIPSGSSLGGISFARQFDKRGRLKSEADTGLMLSGSGTGTIYSYAASYDAVGNMTSYIDPLVMGSWTFHYDTLNRLARAENSAPSAAQVTIPTNPYPNYCWSYDVFGNRKTQMSASTAFASGQGGAAACSTTGAVGQNIWAQYTGTNNRVSASSQNASQTSGYDAAGDITNDGNTLYLYDAESRVCAVGVYVNNALSRVVGYVYDAEGRRVAKGSFTVSSWPSSCPVLGANFTLTNQYLLGLGGEQVTELNSTGHSFGWDHSNVWGGGKLDATYDLKGLHFHLADPLGSRRVQTNAYGRAENFFASLPYGDGLTPYSTGLATSDDATEHHFAQHEHDTESSNDYFGARYYESSMGRFLSPDWSAQEEPVPYAKLDDPQTLNLYGYASNNPLSNIDADGHCWGIISWWQQACNAQDGLGWVSNEQADKNAAEQRKLLVAAQVKPIDANGNPQDVDWNKASNKDVNYAFKEVTAAAALKPVNLPAWKDIDIDIDHIVSGHTPGGSRVGPGSQKDLFPKDWDEDKIERAVREAYKNGQKTSKISTDGRVWMRGTGGGRTIEMVVNTVTKTVESAWPK